MKTVEEIQQEFVDYFVNEDDVNPESTFEALWTMYTYETLECLRYRKDEPWILPSGEVKLVDDFGGEGSGNIRLVIFSVGDRFFRVEGHYSSWNGTDWYNSTPIEVVPQEQIRTIYIEKRSNV